MIKICLKFILKLTLLRRCVLLICQKEKRLYKCNSPNYTLSADNFRLLSDEKEITQLN